MEHRQRRSAATSTWTDRLQGLFSGASRDRTGDLLLAKQALSQLSYGPARAECSGGHPRVLEAARTRGYSSAARPPGRKKVGAPPGPGGRALFTGLGASRSPTQGAF